MMWLRVNTTNIHQTLFHGKPTTAFFPSFHSHMQYNTTRLRTEQLVLPAVRRIVYLNDLYAVCLFMRV